MDPEFKSSFEVSEVALGFLGLRVFYPKRKLNIWERIKQEYFFVITASQITLCVILETIYLYGSLGEDFLTVTDLVTCITFCLVGMSKMVVICMNRKMLQKQFEELHALWPKGDRQPPKVIEIKKQSLKRLRKISIMFFCLYMMIIGLFNTDPLTVMFFEYIGTKKCNKLLPYKVWLPFDFTQLGLYEAVFLFFSWSGYISSIGIVAQDCLFQVSCSHISMLFEIMQMELENIIPENYSYDFNNNNDEDVVIKKLKIIIKRHQKLISFADILEKAFSVVLMINVTTSSIIICLVGFQATIADAKHLIKYGVSTVSTIIQTWIFSWYGDLLIEKSTGLADSCYNCRWYNAGPKFKNTLLILMMRAQKPVHVTAMKFSKICLQSFSSIVSTSWSYFTLVNAVYEPSKEM